MKELLKQALELAFVKLVDSIPQEKSITIQVDLEDIKPINLSQYMIDNGIPDNAWFSTTSERGFSTREEPALLYSKKVPTTDEDKEKYKSEKFSNFAFKEVFSILTQNGYKRTGYNSGLLKQFDDTSVYKMFLNQDYERLEKYYSLPFQLI